ncbi:MAG TPA: response regulator [Candidatus Angelobacter sp.]|nr:response regulator [Candidatus Angelobacter sp.]
MHSAATTTASKMNPTTHKRCILCVDDSAEMLLICRTILEAAGFEVLTASDGQAALKTLEQNPIDAAVIDNRMPGMSGVQLAKEIKRCHKNLPILMFSDSSPERSSAPAFDSFLNKQSGPKAMRDAVRALLEKSPT